MTPIQVKKISLSDEIGMYPALLTVSPFMLCKSNNPSGFPEGDFHPQEDCQDT